MFQGLDPAYASARISVAERGYVWRTVSCFKALGSETAEAEFLEVAAIYWVGDSETLVAHITASFDLSGNLSVFFTPISKHKRSLLPLMTDLDSVLGVRITFNPGI